MSRYLDLEAWPRKASFEFFRGFDKPYFNICTRLDVTELVALKPRLPGSLSLAYHHLALRAAHEVEPFRYRIVQGQVLVLDAVHASMAVLRDDESIAFSYCPWDPDFARFAATAQPHLDAVQRGEFPFEPGLDQNALMHFTTLPWLDFTSFSHARNWGREDSIPKLAFGRMLREDGRTRMAMSVEVHHGLMDGLHVGRYVQRVQALLDNPSAALLGTP